MRRFLVVSAAVVAFCTSRATAQAPLFVSAPSVTVPGGSGYVGLFDLDRDGHLDLISVSLKSEAPEVRLGNGRGGFLETPIRQADFGIKHAALAFGDVNNDGVLDCAQATRDMSNEYIHVFLGSGDGRFDVASGKRLVSNRAIDFYKPQIWLADVNEDARTDIVTQNGRRNTVEMFMGDGRGGFAQARVLSVDEGYNTYSAVLGDVDRDGHLDIAVAMSPLSTREQGRVSVFRGDGAGAFSPMPGTSLAVDSNPILAALADVNGDSRLDMVLGHGEKELLSVMAGEHKGRFAKPLTFPLEPGTSVFTVIARDANRDRRADILVATVNSVARPYNSSVVVLLGTGTTFVPGPGSPFRVGPGAYRMAVGDIDEDGKLDVVTSSRGGDSVHVLMGR